ncbi:TPA: hypothetical protein DCZ39_01265 [Patescibacteria group bacterium]|nr:hypothetical protein [Candidatus Gracilibacteria bacterium]
MNATGMLPSVLAREKDLNQLRPAPDCIYHLLVNSLTKSPSTREFGIMMISLSPYNAVRNHAIAQL